MRARSIRPSLLRDEAGFTLMELLVSMLSATVVAGALFAILIFSTNETSTLADKVQADQLGRIAMTRIVDELHSACLAAKFTPIQANSTGEELIFINAYAEEAVIAKAYRHHIVWNKATGTLTDLSEPSTGGESPNFLTWGPQTSTRIATNISQNEGAPIFQYYKYATETTEGETLPTTTINPEPLAVPLTEKTAGEAASVLVSFNTAPTSGKTTRGVNLSSQVTFAFSVPNAGTPINDAPCQ